MGGGGGPDPLPARKNCTIGYPKLHGDQSRVHLTEWVRIQTIEADSLGLFASV